MTNPLMRDWTCVACQTELPGNVMPWGDVFRTETIDENLRTVQPVRVGSICGNCYLRQQEA